MSIHAIRSKRRQQTKIMPEHCLKLQNWTIIFGIQLMRRHVLPLKKAKILTVWYSPFACIVSLTLILLKELSRVSAHVSHLHSLQCKTAPVPRMVLLWLWLSEQQCKRSRDFLARWDLPDTTLTFYLAAWESNWYFATSHPAERRLRNKHRIPYWWRVATQNLVVLLIGWSHFSTNQVLGSDTSSLISMEFLRLFLRWNQWWLRELSAVFSS